MAKVAKPICRVSYLNTNQVKGRPMPMYFEVGCCLIGALGEEGSQAARSFEQFDHIVPPSIYNMM